VETSAAEQKAYWRKSLTITWLLLFAWVAVTLVLGFHAREARGLTLLYAVIVGLYAWYLSRLDKIHR
jgi:uncharacterized membrane protein